MTDKMRQFISVSSHSREQRDPAGRVADFGEIQKVFESKMALSQSSRCSQCGVPMCQVYCPIGNNIPDWLKAAAEGRLQDAYILSSETNTMPEICGKICPQENLCEGNCVIEESGHGAVTIGAIEEYLTETAFSEGWVQAPKPVKELKMSVGIIGSGPAGMTVAQLLRAKGYEVHIYERQDRFGGLLTYGIPNFKLDKAVVQRRIETLQEADIQLHAQQEIGKDLSFSSLRQRHDAVFIGTGVYKAKQLSFSDNSHDIATDALEYLVSSNRQGIEKLSASSIDAVGKDVIVVGGGDTAMDCARTAVRQKARSVTVVYRRDEKNMPGSKKEVKNAKEEGVHFEFLSNPQGYVSSASAHKMILNRMSLGTPDAFGRQKPVAIEGETFELPFDMVIHALGFDPEDIPNAFNSPELPVNENGTIDVNSHMAVKNTEGVFAGGDITRGASLVVWAIKDGRTAAGAIDRYLKRKSINKNN